MLADETHRAQPAGRAGSAAASPTPQRITSSLLDCPASGIGVLQSGECCWGWLESHALQLCHGGSMLGSQSLQLSTV